MVVFFLLLSLLPILRVGVTFLPSIRKLGLFKGPPRNTQQISERGIGEETNVLQKGSHSHG